MRVYIIAYIATTVAFLGLDATWLTLTMKGIYKAGLGSLLLDKPDLMAAGLFYALYGIGIVAFAVMPVTADNQWMRPLLRGALLGLIAYGTYDLTNLATLRDWSGFVSVVDLAWGTFATGVAAAIGYAIVRRFS